MKRKIFFLIAVFQVVTAGAQKGNPKWLDNAGKAIITVETKTKEGMTRTCPGFFIREDGEAVASYEIFKKAEKAVAITSTGERLEVTHILGADEMYNVIRIKVAVPKKLIFIPVAKVQPALNATAFLPPSRDEKNLAQGAISEITKISGAFDYYKIDMPLPRTQVGFPLLTETGDVFAVTQADATGKDKTYGISIAYLQNIRVGATDMFKKVYTDIGIRMAWSTDFDDAQISLMLYSSQQDVPTYLETLNDFIATFPTYTEGYLSRASLFAHNRKTLASTENEQLQLLDKAWNDLESAAKYAKTKGDGFYNKARVIFGVVAGDSLLTNKNWNMKAVEENLQKALKESNRPLYRQLEGEIAFFQADYNKAFNAFAFVNQSAESTGLSFYYAAKSKQLIEGANILDIISLLDSAVAKSTPNEAAAYLLEVIDIKTQLNLYEDVVNDYNRYLIAMNGNVNDAFYYYRAQAKFRTGDLEGALKDIETAILFDKTNAIYYAEKASIYLRLNDIPKAQENAEKAIELEPEFASAYRLIGVCHLRQEKKTEACTFFNKAKELGDPIADRLIKDNCSL